MDGRIEDMLQRGIERLKSGEPLEEVLRAFPDQAPQLLPLMTSARELLHVPTAAISPVAQSSARQRMLAEVNRERSAPARRGGLLAGFWSQPAFRAASLAGAVALFGAASLGAAAATGSAPEPVRQLFGLSGGSAIRVELDGIVQSVDAANGTLVVATGADLRTVILTEDTELRGGGDVIALTDIVAGMPIEVKGRLRSDNAIIASRVHVEHDGDSSAQPTTDASTPPGDDDDGDDHSGPGGNADDDHELDDEEDGSDEDERVDDDNDAALQTPDPAADDDADEDVHDDGGETEELDDDEPEDDDDVPGAEGHDDEEADESEGAGD